MRKKIAVRADGNSSMGLGHLYRCLGIMQLLDAHFECHFLTRNTATPVLNMLKSQCANLHILPSEEDILAEAENLTQGLLASFDTIILDGYHFDSGYQKIMKAGGLAVVCIDDIHHCHFYADAIINHAGGVTPQDYDAAPYTRFYLGPQYAILRNEYLKSTFTRSSRPGMDRILVCMGGADPQHDTLKVLQYIAPQLNDDIKLTIVTGAGFLHMPALIEYLSTINNYSLMSCLDTKHMIRVMEECGLAILPASTISMEYMSLGGVLYLHQIAENQKNIYQYFINEGMALPLEKFTVAPDTDQFKSIVSRQRQILDRQSGDRIVTIFKNLLHE